MDDFMEHFQYLKPIAFIYPLAYNLFVTILVFHSLHVVLIVHFHQIRLHQLLDIHSWVYVFLDTVMDELFDLFGIVAPLGLLKVEVGHFNALILNSRDEKIEDYTNTPYVGLRCRFSGVKLLEFRSQKYAIESTHFFF